MANTSLGKRWEQVFREHWIKCFPNTFMYRVPDQMNGYKTTSQGICDFFAFTGDFLWLLECKETTQGTLNFSKVPQLERLVEYKDLCKVKPYIIIWFSSKDKVLAVPAQEALKIKEAGNKSISLKMLEDKMYNIIELPAVKKRVFMEADYTYLKNIEVERSES